MTGKPLRIGTRDSLLATWQARFVQERLKRAGYPAELHFIKTEGDRVLDTPLPLMGGKGVFTKALDNALLAAEIDLAVHSLKDIPTRLPDGLAIGAVSEREDTADVLVTRDAARAYQSEASGPAGAGAHTDETADTPLRCLTDPHHVAVIASSSNRRIGQWLSRYPRHRMTDIRGNVQTRLRKLAESDWDGAIFAAAGLIRLGLNGVVSARLDWMLPAPAQGAMAVMIRADDDRLRKALDCVQDPDTALCTSIERGVLHTLEGGCSAPVGALAVTDGGRVRLRVATVYPDGTGFLSFEVSEPRERAADLGRRAADEALRRGADVLIRDLRGGSRDDGDEGLDRDSDRGAVSAGASKGQETAAVRLAISTRTVTSAEVSLAARMGVRLMDYPVWQYRWMAPPPHLTAAILAGAPQAWVFTSRRGVEGWWRVWQEQRRKQRLRDEIAGKARARLPDREAGRIPTVYAVGQVTADAARHFFGGAKVRLAEEGDGRSLGEALVGDGVQEAVHFCAVERRTELAEACMAAGISLTEAEVYERGPVPDPKPLLSAFDALLFFSPDGVAEFLRLYGVPGGTWQPVAVGQTTAAAIRKETGRDPLIAASPSFEEMLKLV